MPNILGHGRTADAARLERMSGQHIFGRDHVSKTRQLLPDNAAAKWND